MKKKIGLVVIGFLLIAAIFFIGLSTTFFRIEIPSASMQPTLKIKEQLLVKRKVKDLKRGDILVFYSQEEEQYLVKRLIGLPGENLELKEGTVYVNQEFFPEPYLQSTDSYSGEFNVPGDAYFFLGDNRKNSIDSRFFIEPYIKKEMIAGKVIIRLYPRFGWLN